MRLPRRDRTGITRDEGIVTGNVYDKYGTKNPLARLMVERFMADALDLARRTGCEEIHEVGCGEGHLTAALAAIPGTRVRGCDFSEKIIAVARSSHPGIDFSVRSIYDLDPERDGACLVVCCEVLEHLERPERGLAALEAITRDRLLVSVPREPLWRALNLARGKYVGDLGNTPGHLNHWSRRGFLDFISRSFRVVEVRSPLPWTIALCRSER